ncbi:secreted RxLR effector protein 161-like [Capsicum annuum]|uniref:secreted RxLR effector protein 161-like n=1 Tax=Capsicum annuum TaxID=4072 RepID=UPI001FB0F529|nr:secreted RxLR effector protein 161-like [Capsicum annuum]
MGEAKKMATPMEMNLKMKKDEGKLLKDTRSFQQLVGSLIYLTITRPEIAYSVGVIYQFMQDLRTPHLEAAKRILRYIKVSVDYGLMYEKGNDFVLQGFTDTDWASDTASRRSNSGKNQSTVVLSSTEAKYIAANNGSPRMHLAEMFYGRYLWQSGLRCANSI